MLTTKRRFASERRFFAASLPSLIAIASLISSSEVKSGTRPISFRYTLTGSSIATPSMPMPFSSSAVSFATFVRSTSSIWISPKSSMISTPCDSSVS